MKKGSKMQNCVLCNNLAEEITPTDDYKHFVCSDCGEYKISNYAIADISDQNRFLLSFAVFKSYFYMKKPLFLTSEVIESIQNNHTEIKIIDKLFCLAKYVYLITSEKNIGFKLKNIPNACCNARNSNEQLELLKTLQENRVLIFEEIRQNDFKCYFGNIIMTSSAFMKFQTGIDSAVNFQEVFMEHDKQQNNFNFSNNQGNINLGANSNQSIQIQKGITEDEVIQNLLANGIGVNIIDKIRPELKDLVKEYNKDKINNNNISNILCKLKTIVGNVVLSGLSFLSKPEVIQLIQNIKNNT